MKTQLNDGYYLDEIKRSDKAAYIEHFKVRQIYEQTLNIPFPYGEAEAEFWFNMLEELKAKRSKVLNYAIREPGGRLIGAIGFSDFEIGKDHKAEVGYWLAKPFWGKGIVADALKVMVDWAFIELKLIRITAHIFAFNSGSQRVLEKNGFVYEGTLKKHYRKDGKFLDGKLFALVRE